MPLLRVALTGGIATGKSYVLGRFAARSVPTIDADTLVHRLQRPGQPVSDAIRSRFGSEVFRPDGEIDRERLGARVFGDAAARADLEAIVHPHVRAAIDRWFAGLAADPQVGFGVADIPLLFETGRESEFDRVVVTSCDAATQLTRVMSRDRLSEAAARARLAAQLPTATKVARADFVIRTDASLEETDRQVERVCGILRGQP